MKKLYLPATGKSDEFWEIKVADGFWTRLRGLLGTKELPEQRGLLLRGCNSVHMIGMLYALDIVYLDRAGVIVKIVEDLKPLQLSCCWQAKDVLEIKSGAARREGWQVGKQLQWQTKRANP